MPRPISARFRLGYSCRGRSFCPSCEKKRSLLWAEWLRQEVLEPVPHRHVVVTIPRLLRPLFRRRELANKLLSWRHPGFSAHAGEAIPAGDSRAMEDMASYVVRNPVSLRRLVYVDGQQAVIYRGLRPNPSMGQNFLAMQPLEWLARMADHIPDPGRHRTLFYAHYANRARGNRARQKPSPRDAQAAVPKKRRCPPAWARLIAKVYQVDPLRCRRCGGKLQIVAYINDHFTINKILDHLGLGPPEKQRPPPEIRYLPLDEEGGEIAAAAEEAFTP